MRSRLPVRRLIALATIGSLTAFSGAAFTAGPAAAAKHGAALTPTTVYLFSSSTKVVSSTHKKLTVSVSDTTFPASPTNVSSVHIIVSTRNGKEQHSYGFAAGNSSLTVDSTGKGTLKVPATAIGSYGVVSLKITPAGKSHTTKCSGQPATVTKPVKLTGKFFLNTKSKGTHKWGTVGSKRHFTFATPNTVQWSYPATCPTFYPPCASSFSWNAYGGKTSMGGSGTTTGGTIYASRFVLLTRPKGASRSDTVTFTGTWKLKVAKNNSAILHIKSGAGGVGLATMKSLAPSPPTPVGCGKNFSRTEKAQNWGAKYINGRPPLKAKAKIFGGITVKNTSTSGETSFRKVTK